MHCHVVCLHWEVILAVFCHVMICLRVKVIIAMICYDLCDFLLTWNSDLCDFLLTWNSDFAISITLLCIVKDNFIFISFSTTANFAAVNPDHESIYGGIAECRRKFSGLYITTYSPEKVLAHPMTHPILLMSVLHCLDIYMQYKVIIN